MTIIMTMPVFGGKQFMHPPLGQNLLNVHGTKKNLLKKFCN